jgi:MFS family permease
MAAGLSNAGLAVLVATQAISAFSQNLLRSMLLTLVAFGSVDTSGLGSETTIALATLFLVAPFAFLSMPAGRLADRFPKASILRAVKAFEVAVFCLAAFGLWAMSVPVLLVSVLFVGIAAAIFGPAKFGILPELLPNERLIRGNAWVSATGTLAILAGLIAGNLLAGSSGGLTSSRPKSRWKPSVTVWPRRRRPGRAS